jgi:hypothetical protein
MAKKKKADAIPYDRRLSQRMLDDAIRATRTAAAFRAGSVAASDRMLAARSIAKAAEARLGREARRLADGLNGSPPSRADLAAYSADARRIIASAHMAAARVYTGRTPTLLDRARLDEAVRAQLDYHDAFMKRSRGDALTPRFPATARLYGAAVWTTSQNYNREAMIEDRYTYERAFLSVAEHCPGCIDRAERGWSPIGTLPPLGDSECRVRCQCYFLFRRGDSVIEAESPDDL